MDSVVPATAKVAPTSVPAIHELAGYLPGRLEFEHEIDNEAEDVIKDITFGSCFAYGGEAILEDENDPDLRSRQRWIEGHTLGGDGRPLGSSTFYGMAGKGSSGKGKKVPASNGYANGHRTNGAANRDKKVRDKNADASMSDEEEREEDAVDDDTEPLPVETEESLAFKLTLIESYSQRLQKRNEGKELMFDRALIDFKKVSYFIVAALSVLTCTAQLQANDKKRPKEEKDLLTRLRPFAKLQTAEDFEVFVADILCETSSLLPSTSLAHTKG
jgi:transcriptional adapter 2-alpha